MEACELNVLAPVEYLVVQFPRRTRQARRPRISRPEDRHEAR